jgi:glycosyltransferase involved in cell wall biosynthesis
MKIKGIKYIAPIMDGSGYAKAARGYVLALHKLGVPLTISPITFEQAKPDLGKDGEVLKSLVDKDIDYNIVLMHCTPEFWPKFKEEDKINIGYTIWETTKLHHEWPDYINNNVDKVLVGCDWNINIFKKSGVTVPIASVPHAIPLNDVTKASNYNIEGLSDDTYVFGFVNQFVERKNPLAVIKAFWYAFQNNEDVALVLKTYRSDYSEPEKDAIRMTIQRLKQVAYFENYPKVYFIGNMLSEDEMRSLYQRMDCFVSLDRGEGFGLSPFTAGAYGKPVIATGFGGAREYLQEDNSFLVNYTLEPVFGMPYSRWMVGNMLWANPDVKDGIDKLRYVYNNRKEAEAKGKLLKTYIEENFNDDIIGTKMLQEIEEAL